MLSLPGLQRKADFIFDRKSDYITKKLIGGENYKIFPDSEIDKTNVDIMIVSSFIYRKEITQELEKYQDQFEIVDIYDELL